MSTDSGSADREVWQVMCGGMEPRFDPSVGPSSSNTAVSTSAHPTSSWPATTGADSWDPAAGMANTARGWGHQRIEPDDAFYGLEGSLTSMMRGIADEGMASLPWSAHLNATKAVGDIGGSVSASDTGLQWNTLMGNMDHSSFAPFSSDNWSYFPNSGSVNESAKPKWDVMGSEKKNDPAIESGPADSAAPTSKNDNVPKLSSASSEPPEGHSRSSSITVVASETSLSTMDTGSSVSLGQPTVTTTQLTEANNSMIIEKLINSNEGWGKRPVRQDIPWMIDDTPESVSAVDITDPNQDGSKPAAIGGPAEVPNAGLYWGGVPSRPAPASDFVDSDISMWNGPPESGNSALWAGLPKDAGWPGMTSLGLADPAAVLSGPPPPLGSVPSLGLASHLLETSSCPGVPASFIDVMQRELTGTGTRDVLPRGSVDPSWSHMLDPNRQNSAVDGSSGVVPGRDHISPPSSLQKIDNWNDPQYAGGIQGQGLWNQPPPVMPAYQQQFPAVAGGVKPQRGRMLRGQSTNEAGGGTGFVFPDSGMQSGRASAFQPVFNSAVPPPAHRKQPSGGGGWQGAYSQPPATGPQLSPVALKKMLELQAMLQPLLNERSGVQQSKTLSAGQRRQALDQLNPVIDAIKRQMDQLQGVPMPPLSGMPADAAGFSDVAALLNRLRLEPDASGIVPGMQLPAAGDVNAGMRAPAGHNSPGSEAFGGSWMGMPAAQGQAVGWADQVPGRVPQGIRSGGPAVQQFGGNGGGGRSAMWSPQYSAALRLPGSEKLDTAGAKASGSSVWLKISNIPPQVDGQVIQMLCMQYGQLATFLYNKTTSHAFACYTVADNARRACSAFTSCAPGTIPLTTEVVPAETVTRLIEGQQASGWVQMPIVANGSQMPLYCKP